MIKQEYFIKLVEKKKTNAVLKTDILSSGMCISQSALASYIKHYKGGNDYKQYAVLKNDPERHLGPGKYSTPPPPKPTSFLFSTTPRFSGGRNAHLSGNNSAGKIRNYERLPNIEDASLSKSTTGSGTIINKIQKRKIGEILNKKTKEIIDSQKKENLIRIIREKQLRAEHRKDSTMKDSICKTLATLTLFLFMSHSLQTRFKHNKLYKLKIRKYSRFFVSIARALGKFKMSYRRASTKKGWKILKEKLPVYIKRWQQKRVKRLFVRINFLVELYLDKSSIIRIISALTERIVYLQRSIRSHLAVMRARKYCLGIFWTKCDKTKAVVPIEIKKYYIDKYINKKLNDHYYSMNNEKPMIFLLFLKQDQEIIKDAFRNTSRKQTFLRIFVKKEMLEIIKAAHDSKRLWKVLIPDLELPKVIISEKLPEQESSKTKSIPKQITIPKKKKLRQTTQLESTKSSPFLRKVSMRTKTVPSNL